MLHIKLNEEQQIAVLEPEGRLTEDDFKNAAKKIDGLIEQKGGIKGIVIHAEHFPGWDSFSALISHFKFVKNHHKKVHKVAVATDSILGSFLENVASHFISAEVKRFSYNEVEQARCWITETVKVTQ